MASHKYGGMAVRFPLATLLGGGIGWGIGFIIFSAINSNSAYQVSFGSRVLVLLLSFTVGLVPLFAVMLKLARYELKLFETKNEDEDTNILWDGCASALFLIVAPAGLLLVLLDALLKRLPTSSFSTLLMGTDPQWLWVVFVGLGLLAAFAVGMGGSIAFLVWQLTWFSDDCV